MYFESELVSIGEDFPKFELKSDKSVWIQKNPDNSQQLQEPTKVFQCPRCGLRFINFTSFIKVCGKHVRDLPKASPKEGDKRRKDQSNKRQHTPETKNGTSKRPRRPTFQLLENFKMKKLPPDYFFYCKLCCCVTRNFMGYRDHLIAHDDPSLKYCQVCDMEFSSYTGCKKHKARVHPEVSEKEIKERREYEKKYGKKKCVYNIIHKSKIIQGVPKPKPDQIHPKKFKIVIEPICLPGFLQNDWISLPKPGSKFPWIRETSKKPTTGAAFPVPVKEESVMSDDDDDFSWPMTEELKEFQGVQPQSIFSAKYQRNVSNEIGKKNQKDKNVILKTEVEDLGDENTRREAIFVSNIQLNFKEENDNDDFYTMMDETYHDDSNDEMPLDLKIEIDTETDVQKQEKLTLIKNEDDDFTWPLTTEHNAENSSSTQTTEIPNFTGAKYLYIGHRQSWRSKLNKVREHLGLVNPKRTFSKKPDKKERSDFITCQICNAIRKERALRYHVATHYYEEAETECRVCGCKKSGVKLKMHYRNVHDVNIRERLMKEQQERMEKGFEDGSSNYVTCSICYTNLKTDEHLKYHVKILHEYDPNGGIPKQNLTKECTICNRTFASRENYRQHLWKMHPELMREGKEAIICDECGKTFYDKTGFITHFFRTHRRDMISPRKLKDASTICDQCGHLVKRNFSLHKCDAVKRKRKVPKIPKTPTTIKNKKKSRSCPAELRHAHASITDFTSKYCHICDKTFAYRRGFRNHCQTILYGNFCKCHFCDETFYSYDIRKKHEKEMHKGVKREEFDMKSAESRAAHRLITNFATNYCHVCDKTFDDKNKFRHHVSYVLQEPFRCEFPGCEGAFNSRSWLKQHIQRFHS